jgi:Outer membrane protein beta-barrel domain
VGDYICALNGFIMSRYLALLLLLSINISVGFAQQNNVSVNVHSNGQSTNPNDTAKFSDVYRSTQGVFKPARDFFMIQFGYNNWAQKPDSVKAKSVGYFFNAYLCYDFPINRSRLSFATGLGINTSVVYLDQQLIRNSDTGSANNLARFVPDTVGYKRYKFVTTYLQAPFELRYYANKMNRNRGFKAAIGVQVGTLLGAHTKGVRSVNSTVVKDKVDTKRFVSPWNFAATARIGWGNFTAFGSYNLSNVFRENQGPVITPFSAGICISGL